MELKIEKAWERVRHSERKRALNTKLNSCALHRLIGRSDQPFLRPDVEHWSLNTIMIGGRSIRASLEILPEKQTDLHFYNSKSKPVKINLDLNLDLFFGCLQFERISLFVCLFAVFEAKMILTWCDSWFLLVQPSNSLFVAVVSRTQWNLLCSCFLVPFFCCGKRIFYKTHHHRQGDADTDGVTEILYFAKISRLILWWSESCELFQQGNRCLFLGNRPTQWYSSLKQYAGFHL